MKFLCRLLGHTEGRVPISPAGFLRTASHRCWRCGEPVPTELRSEYLTTTRVHWRN